VIHIVDIGSLRLPDGDVPYQPLLDRGLGRLTEFDPQVSGPAIGNGHAATLHICAYPGWSSLLRPSAAFLEAFPGFIVNARVIREMSVFTCRLDDLDIAPIDFLKMDVQGSELMILENGREKLRECAVVQLEVPFLALYDGQPQLWQLDRELRSQGFILDSFVGIKAPFEADVLYVRDYVSGAASRKVMDKMHLILTHCYQRKAMETAA
jgi:hypothetical protein